MGCTGSKSPHTWLDGRFTINSHHTLFDSTVENIFENDFETTVNFNTAFGAPWWITFQFDGLLTEIGGVEIASCHSESSPRIIQIMASQDMLKWRLVGTIVCDEPWGTGAVGKVAVGDPAGEAIKAWGFDPPICAKYLRIRVLQTFNDCGPSLHYIRLSRDPLPPRFDIRIALDDIDPYLRTNVMGISDNVADSASTTWSIVESDPCRPEHPITNLSQPVLKNYSLFAEGKGRGPWTMVIEIKTMVYELSTLEMVSYIDVDSPKVLQLEVCRDRNDGWTHLAVLEAPLAWGSGHRMPCRPHPETGEVNVARTQAGSAGMRWKLPPCSLKYPQFLRLSISQTFSGRPPSLHFIKLSHRASRPRSHSVPNAPLGSLRQAQSFSAASSSEAEDTLGPLRPSSRGRIMRRGSV